MFRKLTQAFLLVLCIHSLCSGSDDIASVLDGLKKRYGSLEGLTVPYKREVISRTMSMLPGKVKGDVASGILHFRVPSSMRMEQQKPEPELLVSDGVKIWWYVPAKNLVHVYPFRKFGKEFLLLADVLRGLSNIGERFVTALLPQEVEGVILLELKPEPPWEDISSIVLYLSSDHKILSVRIHNTLGNITHFELGDTSAVTAFPADFFSFSIPDGAKIVEEGD